MRVGSQLPGRLDASEDEGPQSELTDASSRAMM